MARYSLDLNAGEVALVQNCRTDMEWQGLSLGNKLKILVIRKAQEYEAEKEAEADG